MLMMILLYLFLGACFMNNSQVGTYIGNENNFDLFYCIFKLSSILQRKLENLCKKIKITVDKCQ